MEPWFAFIFLGQRRHVRSFKEGLVDVPDKEDAEAMFYWKRAISLNLESLKHAESEAASE